MRCRRRLATRLPHPAAVHVRYQPAQCSTVPWSLRPAGPLASSHSPTPQVVSPLQSSVASLEAQVLGVPAEVRGQVAAAQADLGKGATELRSQVGRGAPHGTRGGAQGHGAM